MSLVGRGVGRKGVLGAMQIRVAFELGELSGPRCRDPAAVALMACNHRRLGFDLIEVILAQGTNSSSASCRVRPFWSAIGAIPILVFDSRSRDCRSFDCFR